MKNLYTVTFLLLFVLESCSCKNFKNNENKSRNLFQLKEGLNIEEEKIE